MVDTGSDRSRRRGPRRARTARRGRAHGPRRGRRARADAPQRRARAGRGRPRPVPGHEARHRTGHRRRLLLRLPPAAPAHARRPAGDRGADARVDRRRPPVRVQRGDPGGGPRRPRRADQPFKVEIVDDLLAAAEARRHADAARRPSTGRARSSTCAAARTCADRQDRPVQAARHGRRVLARRREAADAPARLRHGLGDPGGARPVPRGAAPRRRSATTAGSGSPSTSTRSTMCRRDRRSGTPRASASGARSRPPCASSRSAAATRRSRRRSWSARSCGASPATGTSTPRTCSSSRARSSSSASSR